MIKVLFLIHDLSVGGAEKVLVNLVNNMDKNGFDVTVMSLFDVGVNKQFLKSDVTYKSCFKHPVPGNSHYLKLLSPKQLYKWLIKDEYDVVVSYLEGPTARIVGGAPEGVKVVSWVHCTIADEKELAMSFRSVSECKRCYSRADKMVFVSKGVQDAFQRFCTTKNNTILYNTNDSDLIIIKSHEEISEPFPTDRINICAVGKLAPVKGFDRLIKIQKRLIDEGCNVHLHILGIGNESQSLREQCNNNGINDRVTFWGYQTNPYKYVANCDLYVCSSYAEGFSTAATEALIVGTPVCTVEVSGMKEMLGENNEYGVVTENDDEKLYRAIKELIDTPALLDHYKKQAIERGKKFSTEQTVSAVEEMLLSLQ